MKRRLNEALPRCDIENVERWDFHLLTCRSVALCWAANCKEVFFGGGVLSAQKTIPGAHSWLGRAHLIRSQRLKLVEIKAYEWCQLWQLLQPVFCFGVTCPQLQLDHVIDRHLCWLVHWTTQAGALLSCISLSPHRCVDLWMLFIYLFIYFNKRPCS